MDENLRNAVLEYLLANWKSGSLGKLVYRLQTLLLAAWLAWISLYSVYSVSLPPQVTHFSHSIPMLCQNIPVFIVNPSHRYVSHQSSPQRSQPDHHARLLSYPSMPSNEAVLCRPWKACQFVQGTGSESQGRRSRWAEWRKHWILAPLDQSGKFWQGIIDLTGEVYICSPLDTLDTNRCDFHNEKCKDPVWRRCKWCCWCSNGQWRILGGYFDCQIWEQESGGRKAYEAMELREVRRRRRNWRGIAWR